MTNAHFIRDVLQYNTGDLYIYLHKRVKKIFFTLRKTAPMRADLHVGNRRRGVQGVTYFVRDIILGPTVLAKTVGPTIMSRTKYVTPCTPRRLFPTCKSALIGAVLRNVKKIFFYSLM